MAWQTVKDNKYYDRLAMISKVRRYVESKMEFGVPLTFNPPILYTHHGGKKLIMNIERHKYMSEFKREFKMIRCLIDDGTYVSLKKLRMQHAVDIYKQLPK